MSGTMTQTTSAAAATAAGVGALSRRPRRAPATLAAVARRHGQRDLVGEDPVGHRPAHDAEPDETGAHHRSATQAPVSTAFVLPMAGSTWAATSDAASA